MRACAGKVGCAPYDGGVVIFFVSYSKKKEKGHSLIRPILRKCTTEVIVFLELLNGREGGELLLNKGGVISFFISYCKKKKK